VYSGEQIKFILPGKPLDYLNPGAWDIRVHFATPAVGASARSVQQAFGAAGNRADPSGIGQKAVAAAYTHFPPNPRFK